MNLPALLLQGIVIALIQWPVEAETCGTYTNQSPPAPAICGSYGSLGSPAILQSFPKQQSPYGNACVDACFATTGCQSLSFALSTYPNFTNCVLYSKKIYKMGFTSSSQAGPIYFDQTCFGCITCSTTTDAPTITNGGFDNSAASIAPWKFQSNGPNYQLVPSEAGDGNAFSITLSSSTQVVNITQTIPLCAQPGTSFTFSFIYRFGVQDKNYQSHIQFYYNGNGNSVSPVDTKWHQFTGQVSFTPNTPVISFIPEMFTNYKQTYYIDNVQFVQNS